MGKQFSSPTIEGINAAVQAANAAVAAVDDAVADLAAQISELKTVDVVALSAQVSDLADVDVPALTTKVDNLKTNNKYSLTQATGNVTIAAANVFQTLYNLTGAGFLGGVRLSGSSSGAGFKGNIKITVDGVVKFQGKSSAQAGAYTGVIPDVKSGTGLGATTPPSVNYPYTTNGENVGCFVVAPIYFNASLKIEVTCDGTGIDLNYDYKVGVAS